MAMGLARSSGRSRRSSKRAPMADINVTPLVDVMLVLLIIFMVTAPLLKAAVPVELPDSRAKAMAEEADQITISVDSTGRIYLDDEELAPGALAERLARIPKDASGKPPLVTLRADQALSYGIVTGVMGELNHAGFNSISLVTNSSGRAQ